MHRFRIRSWRTGTAIVVHTRLEQKENNGMTGNRACQSSAQGASLLQHVVLLVDRSACLLTSAAMRWHPASTRNYAEIQLGDPQGGGIEAVSFSDDLNPTCATRILELDFVYIHRTRFSIWR